MAELRYLLLAACAFLWSARAEAVTVALLRPLRDSAALEEAVYRVQGELLAVGASVTILDGPAARDRDSEAMRNWLEKAARERAIDAFIDVIGDDTPVAADIWICERSPPLLRVSRVALEPDVDDRARTLAIRSIEVLRSSFLAFDLGVRRRAATPVSPPPSTPEAPPPREPVARLGLEAGATALTSFGDVGTAFLALARIDWALSPWLSLQATAAGLGTRPQLETSSGEVYVARSFGLFGVCLCRASPEHVHPVFSLSAGALRTALDAEANLPHLGHHLEQWAALFDVAVGARLGLPGRLYLTLAGHVQLAEPYVAIHVVDAVVATTGRPNVLLTLTAGARP